MKYENDIEKLREQANTDLELREVVFEKKLYEIPIIHSRWLSYLYSAKEHMMKLEFKKNQLYRELWYWYKEKSEQYVEDKHIPWHIETDDRFKKVYYLTSKQELIVKFCESVVKKTSQLTFDVKNIIEHEKFISGTN